MSAPAPGGSRRVAIVVKGYPRLSETFIAQEMLALQGAGVGFDIWALRRPTDKAVHAMNRAITARRKDIALDATAVPKTLAASLDPSAHPR